MSDEDSKTLREQLAGAVRGGEAHLDIGGVFDGVRDDQWGAKVKGAPHTLWQLMEHTRIALHDLYVFSTDPHYKPMQWPQDYWPQEEAPGSAAEAKQALAALKQDVETMAALAGNGSTDLFAKIAWGDGQTTLREVLLAATHTSYHLGQAMFLRKQLEA